MFDTLAAGYDAAFTHTTIGAWLRGQTHTRLARLFAPGDHVLELGCGTGEDACWLGERGVHVLATDASAAMVAAAAAKTVALDTVRVVRLDLHHLDSPTPADDHSFDGVFSSFGALNCLDRWDALGVWLAQRVRVGGCAAFGVMSPLCLWEIVWHGAHGDWHTALRRLRRGGAAFGAGHIHYPSIGRLRRAFGAAWRVRHIMPLGLWLPPSDVYGAVERRPALLRLLTWLETHAAGRSAAAFADHYWIELERVRAAP